MSDEPGGGRPPAPPADLDEISRYLTQVQRTVVQLQRLVLSQLQQSPPLTLDVEHLTIDKVEFHVDSIDVEELSGELNIGLNNRFTWALPEQPDEPEPDEQGDADEAPPAAAPLWPPPEQEEVDQKDEQ